jgi:predicted ferric reductase
MPSMIDSAPAVSLPMLVLTLTATAAGALVATALMPAWLPGMAGSLAGERPQAFWFISRSTALVAYSLLWVSMMLGLSITSRAARLWPGGPAAFDLHQHTSLLGLTFGLIHALVLLGDGYIGYTLGQIATPFASEQYKPLWVGLGQLAGYGMLGVSLSFYVKKQIGPRGWRAVHFLSFLVFGLTLAHGVASGTDTAAPAITALYWASGGSVLFLTTYRVLTARYGERRRQPEARSTRSV